MATKMHRLQISLPDTQLRHLEQRARLEGVSMAELVRRLIERDAASSRPPGSTDGLWDIAGIAEDRGPRIEGVAVSERPELYLYGDPDTRRS
jgi:hypothetical protein